MFPEKIQNVANLLAKLPGIGPRQAARIALHLASLPKQSRFDLREGLSDLDALNRCEICQQICNRKGELCEICSDLKRDVTTVAVVEKETDLSTLEKTGQFKGRYLVLGPLSRDGILTPEHKRRLDILKKNSPDGGYAEIILALSPTTYGDVNASVIEQELRLSAKQVTRLGRGIPTGSEVEFADEETLSAALRNRH